MGFGSIKNETKYVSQGVHQSSSQRNKSTTKKSYVQTLLWNAEGLINALDLCPQGFLQQYDVVILNETFITKDWGLPGFYCMHRFASQGNRGRPKGGISCLIKPELSPFKKVYETDNIVLIQTKPISILCAYFQPDFAEVDIIDELGTALSNATTPLLLAGDLNCRIDISSNKSKAILEYLEQEGLSLTNKREEKTYLGYNGSSTLDLIFISDDIRVKHQAVLYSIVARKHLPVETTLAVNTCKHTTSRPRIRISRKLNCDLLHIIDQPSIMARINSGNIDQALTSMENHINNATLQETPNIRKAKPWFTKECYKKRSETLTALHRARTTGTETALRDYSEKRKCYKETVKTAKENFQLRKETRAIEDAEKDPFIALIPREPRFPRDIPMSTWVEHLSVVLQARDTRPSIDKDSSSVEEPVTTLELLSEINICRNRKACGPDNIYYEHLKEAAPTLKELWVALMNECLRQGRIPSSWRNSVVKMLYKGKGDPSDPNSYRGIALENTLFKVLTKILTRRLDRIVDSMIPEEQFGFRRGRSTIHAVSCLLEAVQDALRHPKGKLYAVFIDYTKAFDMIDRSILVHKLECMIGEDHYLARIIKNILHSNYIQIDDNIDKSESIEQTNGVLQGDPLSPLLFNIATADIVQAISHDSVSLYCYADDMAIVSTSRDALQISMDKLTSWAQENEMLINPAKTVMLTFRKGGKLAADNVINLNGEPLVNVSHFNYLGVVLQTQGNCFTQHVKLRAINAIKAIQDIQQLGKLSLGTALQLFKTKIAPIATYGIEPLWHHLTKSNLQEIEKVKSTFLKKILCLSKFTPNRLVYELARETFFIEDLRLHLLLPSTRQYDSLLQELNTKRSLIWLEFYTTEAMTSKTWWGANYDLRHTVTRFAVHGFHHKICVVKSYHIPGPGCVCELCGRACDRYHALICCQRHLSLNRFCNE